MKRPLEWQIATVSAIKPETANVKTLTLTLPARLPHRAGQYYVGDQLEVRGPIGGYFVWEVA